MITKKDIIDTITLLKMTYPGALKDMQDNELKMMIEIWFQDFKDTPKEDFNKAINDIRYTEKFFPSIALIKETLAKQKTIGIPSAEEEWDEVKYAIRKYGSYRVQEAYDSFKPLTREIVEHIGFYNICQATKEQQIWNRKEFIDTYNSKMKYMANELQIGNKEMALLNG